MKLIYTFIIYSSSIYFFIINNKLNVFQNNIINKLFIFLLLFLIDLFINISLLYLEKQNIIFLSLVKNSLFISLFGLLSYIFFLDIYNIFLCTQSKFINTSLLSFFISFFIIFILLFKKYIP
jgi:hypothetical protein